MSESRKSLLREAAFRNFFLGRAISRLGNAFTPLALAFGVLDGGGSAADLGVILAAVTLPQLLFLLVGGVVGDRFDRRIILIGTDLVMGIAQAISAALFILDAAELWQLVCLQFLVGCASAFFNPASQGAIRDVVGPERVQVAQSLLSISGSSTRIIGPAMAAALIAATDAGVALAIDALSFFISAAFLTRVKMPRKVIAVSNTIKQDLSAGWQEVSSRSWVWGYILSACVFQATSLPALAILGPVISKTQLGGASAWATVLSVQSVGAVLAGFILMKWRPLFPMRTAVLLLFLSVPLPIVLAMTEVQVLWLLVPALLAGLSIPMSDTLWFAALAENIPEEAQSRVSSYDWLGSLAFAPLGYWVIGQMADIYEASLILLSVGILEIVATGAAFALPGIRRLSRAPQVSASS